ncbi:quinone oxidoreductase PIG3 isoform X2 [Octopus sinensis]|nr:quinone oxidoreductase PIG3 isoform X2 [Octopus sinensis]
MLAAYFDSPGEPDVLYVNQVPIPELEDNEVLVKVQASAINRADTLQRRGLYPIPPGASPILGLEVSGTIEKVGASVGSAWKVGDKVMCLCNGGGNAEFVAVHFKHVMPMPANTNFLEAAAIPEVWLTAFQLLHFVGKLQPEDYVLIHAGASGVGTAAIQLVTLAKGKAIVTAGSEDKIKLALELGASAGFNYKETDFSEEVMKFTEGRGVNLILDCVGGVYWEMNVNCLAMDGRWVLYGLLGGRSVNGNLFLELLKKRISLMATTLRTRTDEYKGQLVEAFSQQALSHFERGYLKPVMDSVFPLDQISAAHEKMEANKNMGKIMIRVAKDNTDAIGVVDSINNINKEETQIKAEL